MSGGFIDSRNSRLRIMRELVDLRHQLSNLLSQGDLKEQARTKDQQISRILGDMQKQDTIRRVLRERVAALKEDCENANTNMALIVREIDLKDSCIHELLLNERSADDAIKVLLKLLRSFF
jgi:hypothetical protein